MKPTINKNDRIIADYSFYKNETPKRGDIVVFRYPKDPKKIWIKRLIAFGGENIEIKDGTILINGEILNQSNISIIKYSNAGDFGSKGVAALVPEDNYFLLGDNSEQSLDSRYFGPIPKENVVAKATIIYWPLTRLGEIE